MDLAQIGFRVDTGDLEKAVTKLNAIRPVAAGVVASADKVAAAMEGAGASVQNAALAVARSKQSEADAIYKAALASGTATKADIAAAAAAKKQADAAYAVAKAERDKAAAVTAAAAANRKAEAAAIAAAEATRKQAAVTAAARGVFNARASAGFRPDNPNNPPPANDRPGTFNVGNIAAQFQDIGVTAAMGMNPLTIALQQGTQLSAVLQTMENPLKGIAAAFRAIISPVSLLTIGVVGLVAIGLQMVDWVKVAKWGLNALADAAEFAIPYILALGAAMTVLYARSIVMGLWAVITAIATMGTTALVAGAQMAAAWVLANPVTAFLAAFAIIITAIVMFRDEISRIIGVDITKIFKDVVNTTIGLFVGAFNAVKETWKLLPSVMGDFAIQTANNVISAIAKMVNASIENLNKLIAKVPAAFGGGQENTISWRMETGDAFDNPFAGSGAQAADIIRQEIEAALQKDYAGAVADAASSAATAAAEKLRKLAEGIGTEGGKKSGGKTEAERYEDVIKGAERRIASLNAEKNAVGMTAQATARLKYETDLLNEAQQKNINLTPQQVMQLGELAGAMAEIEEQTRKTKEAYDFLKDTGRGFIDDLKNGLREGQSAWESFGNAITNVLNKIANKLIDSGVDALFAGLFGENSGGAGGGLLDGLGKMLFSAKGNAFTGSGVVPFASGGAFTNGVYSRPTMFAFANGGAFGVMGEAGPEAVMPLHRGADGSLGVRVAGGSGGGETKVEVNIINNSSANASVQQRQTSGGVEIEVLIDDIAGSKLGEQGSTMNRALNTQNSRRLIQR